MKPNIKAQLRRKEILDKIVLLMDEDGIKNISIADICKAAGLSVGSFYHYFESKEAIYMELFRQMDAYFVNSLDEICASDNELENIRVFAQKYYSHVERWGYYCNRTITLYTLNSDNFYYKSNKRAFYRILKNITQKAYEKRQLADGLTADRVADMLIILLRGYSFDWAKSGPTDIDINMFIALIDLFISSISAKNYKYQY